MEDPAKPQDPSKFQEHMDRLKSVLQDAGRFVDTVKERGKKADETIERLDGFARKLGETLEHAKKMFQVNEVMVREMLKKMGNDIVDFTEGGSGGRKS